MCRKSLEGLKEIKIERAENKEKDPLSFQTMKIFGDQGPKIYQCPWCTEYWREEDSVVPISVEVLAEGMIPSVHWEFEKKAVPLGYDLKKIKM
jgi:hypothetical protein